MACRTYVAPLAQIKPCIATAEHDQRVRVRICDDMLVSTLDQVSPLWLFVKIESWYATTPLYLDSSPLWPSWCDMSALMKTLSATRPVSAVRWIDVQVQGIDRVCFLTFTVK